MTRPYFASEVGVTGAVSKACGVSAGDAGTMVASANEANLNRFGRPIGKKGRENRLKRGWRAFATQTPPDSNGWMDQSDVKLVHAAMHPTLPMPDITQTKDPEWVWERIGDFAIAIAILPHAAGSNDAIARYVGNVPHKGTAYLKRVKGGVRQVKWICPMHPPSDSYTGHWVDWASLKRCALAVPSNIGAAAGKTFYAELYPIGGWTQAKLATVRLRAKVAKAEAENLRLERELARCGSEDCAEQLAGQREAIADRLQEVVEEIREN